MVPDQLWIEIGQLGTTLGIAVGVLLWRADAARTLVVASRHLFQVLQGQRMRFRGRSPTSILALRLVLVVTAMCASFIVCYSVYQLGTLIGVLLKRGTQLDSGPIDAIVRECAIWSSIGVRYSGLTIVVAGIEWMCDAGSAWGGWTLEAVAKGQPAARGIFADGNRIADVDHLWNARFQILVHAGVIKGSEAETGRRIKEWNGFHELVRLYRCHTGEMARDTSSNDVDSDRST